MPRRKADPRPQDPNGFLDFLQAHLQLKNDAALSRTMGVPPPVLSKFRHHRVPIGASFLIQAHDITGITLNDLRSILYPVVNEGTELGN